MSAQFVAISPSSAYQLSITALYEKRCVLCNEIKELTEEHIFAKWISKQLVYDYPVTRSELITSDKNDVQEIAGSHSSRTLKVLCKECNNRWGSNLQSKTIPILRKLMSGSWVRLSKHERAQLARWATGFVFVREFVHPELIVVSPETRLRFRKTSAAPKGFSLWMAPFSPDGRVLSSSQRSASILEPAELVRTSNTKLTIFTLPNMIFFAIFSYASKILDERSAVSLAIASALMRKGFIEVWKTKSEVLALRPPEIKSELYDQMFDFVCEAIQAAESPLIPI
jgi:hypothetical protein